VLRCHSMPGEPAPDAAQRLGRQLKKSATGRLRFKNHQRRIGGD
jgi:hypothetical protein